MITTCTGCHARYRLDPDKVPPRMIRVRCPDCGIVFDLDGTKRDAVDAAFDAPLPGLERAGASVDSLAGPEATPNLDLDLEGSAATPPEVDTAASTDDLVLEPAAAACLDPAPGPVTPPAAESQQASGVAVADPPRPSRRRRRDKSEMLARALVSDILVYNREARDKALSEGNLLEALGPEIKKSWELYKEKVGAETATGTSHFKDALNEILAEGQSIF
jgi:predicted Zn finger-like uncharacterized protein